MVHGSCEEQMEALLEVFERNGATGTDARLISYIPVPLVQESQSTSPSPRRIYESHYWAVPSFAMTEPESFL